jgi:hypothetical protein
MNGTELAIQMMQLHSDARQLMRRRGFEPGHIHEIPEAHGYSLAFGYLDRTTGPGPRQRYFEVPVSSGEYAAFDESVRRRILDSLDARLQGGDRAPIGQSAGRAC